jgi:hypothetical protein
MHYNSRAKAKCKLCSQLAGADTHGCKHQFALGQQWLGKAQNGTQARSTSSKLTETPASTAEGLWSAAVSPGILLLTIPAKMQYISVSILGCQHIGEQFMQDTAAKSDR